MFHPLNKMIVVVLSLLITGSLLGACSGGNAHTPAATYCYCAIWLETL